MTWFISEPISAEESDTPQLHPLKEQSLHQTRGDSNRKPDRIRIGFLCPWLRAQALWLRPEGTSGCYPNKFGGPQEDVGVSSATHRATSRRQCLPHHCGRGAGGLSFARNTASGPCVTWNSKAAILFCVTQETVVLAAPGGLRRCVRFLRRRLGWNQVQLAAAVGRSQQWVSSFESGRTDASLGDVVAALSALEASVIVRASGAPPEEV